MLILPLRHSAWLAPSLMILHGLGVLALWLAALPLWVSALGTVPVLASLCYYRRAVSALANAGNRELRLQWGYGELVIDAQKQRLGLPAVTHQSSVLTVLRFGRRCQLFIWPDTLDSEQHRLLRRYLRELPDRSG